MQKFWRIAIPVIITLGLGACGKGTPYGEIAFTLRAEKTWSQHRFFLTANGL